MNPFSLALPPLVAQVSLSSDGVVSLLAVTAVFVILNMESVEVNLILAKVQMKLALLIIVSLLLGFLLGWLFKSLLAMRPARKEKEKAKARTGATAAPSSDLDS